MFGVCCLLFVVCCLVFVVCGLLFVVCCLVFVVWRLVLNHQNGMKSNPVSSIQMHFPFGEDVF